MGFVKLLLLCSFMFACSMAVGCLPLIFSFSHRHLRTLTTFGVGLLIGTAFIVIIPEGIHTLYTPPASNLATAQHPHSHTADPTMLDMEYWQRWWQGGQTSDSQLDHSHDELASQHVMKAHQLLHGAEVDGASSFNSAAIVRILAAADTQTQGGAADTTAHAQLEQHDTKQKAGGRSLLQHSHEHETTPHAAGESEAPHAHDESECVFEPEGSRYIGASLALGFVVMLLVDRMSGGHSHGPPSPHPANRGTRGDLSQRPSPASTKRVAGTARRTMSDGGTVSSDRDRTDEEDDLFDVVQRTNVIHIAAANTRPIAAGAASTALSATQHSQDVGRDKELTTEEREKERERQRVEREKEREKAHGYAPYASGSLPSADPATSLSSTVTSSNATIGILVHSFVDGLALGAISLSSDSSLEMVVFLAILLHKGPAALGLVSFLMYQGRSQLYIRTQLTVFSLCAPVAALLTYVLLAAPLPSAAASSLPSPSSPSALGLMLLFSGGTFLFTIAVHIMPTIRHTRTAQSHSHGHSRGHSHHHGTSGGGSGSSDHTAAAPFQGAGGTLEVDEERDSELGQLIASQQRNGGQQGEEEEPEPLEWRYVLVLMSGILAPLLFSAGHSHAHG